MSLFPVEDVALATNPVVTPRYYQKEAVEATCEHLERGLTRLLTVLPTGGGKTSVKCWQIEELYKRYGYERFIAMVHREELIEQIKERCEQMLPGFAVTQHGAGRKGDLTANICVASVQSLSRAQNPFIERFQPQAILTDEAHRSAARTYQEVYMRAGVFDGDCLSLGCTATAHRMDKRALFGEGSVSYQAVSYALTLKRAIQEGWLVDIMPTRQLSGIDLSKVKVKGGEYDEKQLAIAVNTHGRNLLAFRVWQAKAGDRQTIVFAVDVAHAFAVAEVFVAAGVQSVAVVHGNMERYERQEVFRQFRAGILQVVVNVNIATEGVDVPGCECSLVLRPTKSWGLFTQMIGRSLRVLPGLIDHLPLLEQSDERRRIIAESDKPLAHIIEVMDYDARAGTEPPTVEGIVGIPPKLKSKQPVVATFEEIEGIDPKVLQELLSKDVDLDDLVKEAARYNILDQIRAADHVSEGSNFAWINLGGESCRLFLSCGFSYERFKRDAHLDEDALGNWTLLLSVGKDDVKDYPMGSDQEGAIRLAEKIIVARWPDVKRIVTKASNQRLEPPSEKQLNLLRQFKVPESELAKMSRRDAATAITLKMEASRRKRSGVEHE